MNTSSNSPAAVVGPTIAPRIRNKILESVQLNRLTIVIGPTGCGKSTLIPSLLLEGLQGRRICCTQPRRLAVVAIAKRVAQLQGVPLGGEKVGYHVGNHNKSLSSTSLLFTTAGILLEDLRANGADALKNFQCLIIDECHERSPESDLVLALVKEFIKTHPKVPIRIVLMSATFDHKRYKNYFRRVPGCEEVETITLETMQSFTAWHQQVETFYLDDMEKFLNHEDYADHKGFLRTMHWNAHNDLTHDARSLSEELVSLVGSLVKALDIKEKDRNHPFLLFCPTYRHLEQMYEQLQVVNGRESYLSVLHSAVDIEDCIRTMYEESSSSHKSLRHIFLASAIADSSITVPGVSVVIDLCRSLEVRWHLGQRQHQPRTVWSSKSICNQRQGRTGRTCAGKVIRLVPRNFFIPQLESWDVPQLQMSSCYNEVLAILCAESRYRPDPLAFFSTCLDPPPQLVVKDALAYLLDIGACTKSPGRNGKWEPTKYGELMSSIPLTVDEARVVLEGARLGLLHETLALMTILMHKPSPIVHHFGVPELNDRIVQDFFPEANPSSALSVAMANWAAYMYWEVEWHQPHYAKVLEAFERRTKKDVGTVRTSVEYLWNWTDDVEQEHIAWCKANNINPTSVRSVTETIESTFNVLFKSEFESDLIKCIHMAPLWKRRADWSGIPVTGKDMFLRVYGVEKMEFLRRAVTALFEKKSAYSALPDAQQFAGVAFPLRASSNNGQDSRPMACIHFLMGNCKYGSSCRHSHHPHARRPLCRFYQNGSCHKGAECVYSHDVHDDEPLVRGQVGATNPMKALVPLEPNLRGFGGPMEWFRSHASTLFLLGEGNFAFTSSLAAMQIYAKVASSLTASLGRRPPATHCLLGVDATRLHCDTQALRSVMLYGISAFAWNFPYVGDAEEDPIAQENLLLSTLLSLACLQRCDTRQKSGHSKPLTLALTLQGDQFSRWNVLRSLWRTNWRLTAWSNFDSNDFPGYQPSRENGELFTCTKAKFYVLTLPEESP